MQAYTIHNKYAGIYHTQQICRHIPYTTNMQAYTIHNKYAGIYHTQQICKHIPYTTNMQAYTIHNKYAGIYHTQQYLKTPCHILFKHKSTFHCHFLQYYKYHLQYK